MKGSPIISIRIPVLFLSMIDAAIKSANKTRKEEEFTRSTWILTACSDKLNHLARSKKRKAAGRKETTEASR